MGSNPGSPDLNSGATYVPRLCGGGGDSGACRRRRSAISMPCSILGGHHAHTPTRRRQSDPPDGGRGGCSLGIKEGDDGWSPPLPPPGPQRPLGSLRAPPGGATYNLATSCTLLARLRLKAFAPWREKKAFRGGRLDCVVLFILILMESFGF